MGEDKTPSHRLDAIDLGRLQLAPPLLSLALGFATYAIARGNGSHLLGLAIDRHSLVAALFGVLPTATHTFGFGSLLGISFGPRRRSMYFAVVVWVAIEVIFEFCQIDTLTRAICLNSEAMVHLGSRCSDFLGGTFDPLDLVAAPIGGVFAIIQLRFFPPRGRPR